jgi:hypothetical protein
VSSSSGLLRGSERTLESTTITPANSRPTASRSGWAPPEKPPRP